MVKIHHLITKIPYFKKRRVELEQRRKQTLQISDFVSTLEDHRILKNNLKLEPKGFERLSEIIKNDRILNSSIEGLKKEIKGKCRPVVVDRYLLAVELRSDYILLGVALAYADGINRSECHRSVEYNKMQIEKLRDEFNRFHKYLEKETKERFIEFDYHSLTFGRATNLLNDVSKNLRLFGSSSKLGFDFLTPDENEVSTVRDFEFRKLQRDLQNPDIESL